MNRIALAALTVFAASLPAQEQTPPPVDKEVVQRPLTEDEKKQNLLEQIRAVEAELAIWEAVKAQL